MFGKLLSKIQKDKPSHPLATDAGIDALLAEIPGGKPVNRLLELAQWLDDVKRFRDEIGLAALCHAVLRLDTYAKPARDELVGGYLDPRSVHHLSEPDWGQLDMHVRMLAKAYRLVLTAARTPAQEAPKKTDLALCAARAMRALVLGKKLQRFRYRNPEPGWWQDAHGLLADASALGVLAAAAPLYDNPQERRTPLQCYLAGLYLELAPLGNLVPQQVEALDRFLELNIEQLELAPQRHSGSTHAIDLAGASGPVKLTAGAADPAGEAVRYCSVRRAQMHAVRLAAQLGKASTLPQWVQQASCDESRLKALLMSLILNWSDKPPQRAASRERRSGKLKVVHGFDMARRMVSYAGYARLGHLPDYEGLDLDALFDENRFGRVRHVDEPEGEPAAKEAVPPEPLAILEQLELSGDRQMMDEWLLADESASGIGAVAPGLLSRHHIGRLVCFRRSDDIDWRLGIVRRIGRDAEKRPSIGIEALASLALCAVAGPFAGDGGQSGAMLRQKVDAILPAADGDEVLLPAGTYADNLAAEIGTGEGTRRVVFCELSDAGSDFDRVKFRPYQSGESK